MKNTLQARRLRGIAYTASSKKRGARAVIIDEHVPGAERLRVCAPQEHATNSRHPCHVLPAGRDHRRCRRENPHPFRAASSKSPAASSPRCAAQVRIKTSWRPVSAFATVRKSLGLLDPGARSAGRNQEGRARQWRERFLSSRASRRSALGRDPHSRRPPQETARTARMTRVRMPIILPQAQNSCQRVRRPVLWPKQR
jgi:hypothetical protein